MAGILIVGSAPLVSVQECVARYSVQGPVSLLLPSKFTDAITDSSVAVFPFEGSISWRNEACRQALQESEPEEVVFVVGDYYAHDNVVRLVRLMTLFRKTPRITMFRQGVAAPLKSLEKIGIRQPRMTLVVGAARREFIGNCVDTLRREGVSPADISLLLPRSLVGSADPAYPTRFFSGHISMNNPGFIGSLLMARPSRVVIVVGETYFHDRIVTIMTLLRKVLPELRIDIHRQGELISADRVLEEKTMVPAGKDCTLVLGTAPREVITEYLGTHWDESSVLLCQEKDTSFFTGRSIPTRYFRKTMSWFNPGCVRAFRELRPTRCVILVGKTYFHDNAVKFLAIQAKMLGLDMEIVVHQNGESRPYDLKSEEYSIGAELVRGGIGISGALVLHALRPLTLIRVAPVWATRLGHFTMDSELYLCRKEIGTEPKGLDLFYYKPEMVSNQTIAAMYRKKMFVRQWVRHVDEFLDILPGADKHRFRFQPGFSRDPDCLFQKTEPHIEFTAQQEREGEKAMLKGGFDPDKPLVLISGRDNAYLNETYPEKDFFKHQNDDNLASSCRNMDIRTFEPGVEALLGHGYQVARMGSHVDRPLQVDHPDFIDYSTNGMRSDFLDIYTPSKCAFFLGAASGILAVPMVFRRPCVYINLIRLEHIHTWDPRELTIFKRIWLVKEKRFMTLSEYMESNAGDWPLERYLDPDIELVDNTAEQIHDVAMEMHHRLNASWQTTEEDEELQQRFWSFFKPGPLNQCFQSRIGARFLRECKDMIR